MGGCPECGGKTIARSAFTVSGGITVRERQCKACGKIFETIERPTDHDTYIKYRGMRQHEK